MAAPVMRSPRSVDLEITSFCNLRCAYCSHFSSPGDVNEDLPLAEWRAFFDELGRLAVMRVTLSGGEPFLRTDLRQMIEGIVLNGLRFSILSNGTLIDDEMAAFLAATRRLDGVQISIDGSGDLTHDVFRGQGNFSRAMDGILTLRRHHLPVSVRVTIHRENVHDLEAVARYLLEDIGLPSFSTNSAGHMGLCRKNAAQTQLTAEEHSAAMEALLRLAARYPGRISATAGPLADGRIWLEMEAARRENRPFMADRGYLTGCRGPLETIAVRADGMFIPCVQLGHMTLGRITRDSLVEVWQHHPQLTALRERDRIPLHQFPFCRDCPYLPFCTGNCPATAYTITGEVNHPSPDACLRSFLKRGGRLPEPVPIAEQDA